MQATDSWNVLWSPLGHGYLSAQLILVKAETSVLNLPTFFFWLTFFTENLYSEGQSCLHALICPMDWEGYYTNFCASGSSNISPQALLHYMVIAFDCFYMLQATNTTFFSTKHYVALSRCYFNSVSNTRTNRNFPEFLHLASWIT